MAKLRVVHHINQFFAGVGGEEKAGITPGSKEGPVGPGAALQAALKGMGDVVGTVYAGDNYLAEHPNEGVPKVVELIKGFKPDVVVSGPAFQAGRYGLNCGAICAMVQEELGIPVVTGMHEENPGVEAYRTKVHIVATRETAAGMNEAIQKMAGLAIKLALKEPVGKPEEAGYFAMGRRVYRISDKPAAVRAVDMLLKKAKGQSYVTEWPLPKYTKVTPAQPLKVLKDKKLAIVTTGGLVPRGNPDRLESVWASKWLKYNVYEVNDLTSDRWQTIHGGFDTTNVNDDPDRMVPLDVLRELEKEGAYGQLHDYVISTVANGATAPLMRKFGQEMARELREANVDGVILTGT